MNDPPEDWQEFWNGEDDESGPQEQTGQRLRVVGRDTRPDIKLTPDTHETTKQMVDAVRRDPNVYVRGGELVHVMRAEDEKVGRSKVIPGTPIVRPAPVSWLRDSVSSHARCIIECKGKSGSYWRHVPPPKDNVIAVKEHGSWEGIRHLSGVIETPALKPDGTILQTPGYDVDTGYLLIPNAAYADVDDKPTHDDAKQALQILRDPFAQLPYVNESHQSATIAAVLTLLARPAISGSVPCFLFDSSTPRSGKSLQVDVVCLIATGRAASRVTYPAEDEELEKVLAGYAMSGASVVNFDNVSRKFGGDPLDKVITAVDKVDFRVLGKTGQTRIEWRAVIFASGNNVSCRGDMLPRVLSPRLETTLNNPETRTDLKYPDLRKHVRENRMALVAAGLTILRAYVAAGCPDQGCPRWGGFESWARLIPHAIVWAGGVDPMGARRGLEGDDDPARAQHAALINGWELLCRIHEDGTKGLSAKKAIDFLFAKKKDTDAPDHLVDLRDAIEQSTDARPGMVPSARRLGEILRKLKSTPMGGRCFKSDTPKSGVAMWRVLGV